MTLPLINPEPSLDFDRVIPFPCHIRPRASVPRSATLRQELADAEFAITHRRDRFGDKPDLQSDELVERILELRSRLRPRLAGTIR